MGIISRNGRSFTLRISLAAVLGSLVLQAPDVRAQTDEERSGARAAATQGAEAYNGKRYAEAVDLFTRAESLVHSPSHLLYMARSLEKLGKLVRARETYLKLTRERLEPTAPQAFRMAQEEAHKDLSALEPRLPYITVQVEGAGDAAVTVTMDGAKVPPALVGLPRPVDPGEHKFQATGSGLTSAEETVRVEEGKRDIVVLKLQASASEAPAVAPAPGDALPASAPPTQADASLSTGGSNGMRIGGFVALGVGVVGVGAGTVFLLKANSKSSDADDLCTLPGGICDPSVRDEVEQLDDDAKSARTLAAVGYIVGGVGIATGVTLLILSANKSAPREHASRQLKPYVQPWVGLGSAGVLGRF